MKWAAQSFMLACIEVLISTTSDRRIQSEYRMCIINNDYLIYSTHYAVEKVRELTCIQIFIQSIVFMFEKFKLRSFCFEN